MTRPHRRYGRLIIALTLVVLPGLNRAQEPEAVRRIALPSLDAQIHARVLSLDGRLNPVHSPELASCVVGYLAGGCGLSPFASILADPHNNEIWEQLADEYYRLATESGDALVALPTLAAPGAGAWGSMQVRRLAHQRITQLPRTALHWYRQRVDAEASTLFEQGRQTRSSAPLRRIVDELFCSSVGDQALDLLGDLAFERGEFDEACHWWSWLAPLSPPTADRLLFPDPTVDLVRVEAKQILGRIFQGRLDEARTALARFKERHPLVRGDLAGEQGAYAAILEKTWSAFKQRPAASDEPWLTFSGAGTRNGALNDDVSWHLWEDGPTWRVALPPLSLDKTFDPPRLNPARRVAFHPIIVKDQILIADHRSVISFHLATGRELFRFDLASAGLIDPGLGIDPRLQKPRFTLSAERDRAYVRLGALGIGSRKGAGNDEQSYLVCLDLTQPEQKKPRLLWHVAARTDDKAAAFFEGSPLVHDGRVYAAWTKPAGDRLVTSIVCYDTQGRQRWAREVSDCPEFAESTLSPRVRQHLLTWTGGQIVYCSHAGAIVAVDAWTGQPTWGSRYPSRGPLLPSLAPSPRELAPCIYANGCIYAAPLDTDRIFCLDVHTGQPRWTLEEIEATHLLGVSRGRLVYGTPDGIRAVDAATGQTAWAQPGVGRLPGLGRGLIAGSWVFWPTQDADLPYRAFAVDNGEPTVDPTRLYSVPVGNWAFGHGALAIAGLDELVVYVPRPPLAGPRPQAWIDELYRKARLHAVAGQTTEAAETYLQLKDATKSKANADKWHALIEQRLMSLVTAADPRAGSPKWLHVFTDSRNPANVRLAAWKRHTDRLPNSEAAVIYRRVVRDGQLRHAWLAGDRPEQGIAWACRRAISYPGDADDALALFHFARHHSDQDLGERLLKLADRALAGGHWGEAADIYRRILALSSVPGRESRAQAGLAKAYDRQRPSGKIAARDGPPLPLVHAWTQDADRVWIDRSAQDSLFFTERGHVTCREVTGSERWKQPLRFAPTSFTRWNDVAVFAGPDAAQAFRVQDGQTVWSLPAPSRMAGTGQVHDGRPSFQTLAQGFVHVERWADTLLLLDDVRRFLRVRLDTGEVTWEHAAKNANARPREAGAFERRVLRLGDELLVQAGDGQPTSLSFGPFGERSRPWRQPPQLVGDNVVLVGDRGRISAYDARPPHEKRWTFAVPFVSSLVGEPARLYAGDAVLLALVPRLDGSEWHRLDPQTGKSLYAVQANRLPEQVHFESVCIGDLSYFCITANRLEARALDTGAVQWAVPLPAGAGGWKVHHAKHYLTIHPMDASADAKFFVELIDPFDGRVLQRLSFADARGPGEVCASGRQLLVSAGGKVHAFRPLDSE